MLSLITQTYILYYSLDKNSIGDTGAVALAEGIKHCTQLEVLWRVKHKQLIPMNISKNMASSEFRHSSDTVCYNS